MPKLIHTSVHCSLRATADTWIYGVLTLLFPAGFVAVIDVLADRVSEASAVNSDGGSSKPALVAHAWRSSLWGGGRYVSIVGRYYVGSCAGLH